MTTDELLQNDTEVLMAFSGLGRLHSNLKVGSAGTYFESMTVFEIVLGDYHRHFETFHAHQMTLGPLL